MGRLCRNISTLILCYLAASPSLWAQTKPEVQADELIGTDRAGKREYLLKGNVVIRHGEMILYCDSALQDQNANTLLTFGRNRLIQADTINMTADNIFYDGNSGTATANGNVILRDPSMTLTAPTLDYNRLSGVASYQRGGTIVDSENTLTSRKAWYYTDSKMFFFKDSVRLNSRENGSKLKADTLQYHTTTKTAYFRGDADVTTPDGNMKTDRGTYHTHSRILEIDGRNIIMRDRFVLKAKSIFYNEFAKSARAAGSVELEQQEDSIRVYGERAFYTGLNGKVRVLDDPMMLNWKGGDTLFLKGDTLLSVQSPDSLERALYAWHQVRIFRKDLQAISDSLYYNIKDSVLTLCGTPMMWSGSYQLNADTIKMYMSGKSLSRMEMIGSAWAIAKDTLGYFNQIKGRMMQAYFKSGKIDRIDVDGNCESIFHALEKDSVLVGVNKTVCSNMQFRFADGKIKSASFIGKPTSSFAPPKGAGPDANLLEGFSWKPDRRPQRGLFVLPTLQP